ncbi:MAG: metallophosphoesterase [Rhodospirillales bacterium]|jgi:hypothetical protein|nr:metallophosphoesterase [Rhodospirillales bacterium]MDP6884623.1 metallophosphoesterase [Rhodospirillales bacterium]
MDYRPRLALEAIGLDSAVSSRRHAWRRRRWEMEESGRLQSVVGPRSRLTIFLKRHLFRLFHLGSPPIRLQRLHDAWSARAKEIDFVHHRIFDPGLPKAFDGYRIIHLSDPHFDALPGIEERISERLAGTPADAFVVTGDFADRHGAPPGDVIEPLSRVLSSIRPTDGVFATLGNHDSWGHAEVLQSLGMTVLVNESFVIRRGADSLVFTGTDDPSYFFTEAAPAALRAAPDGFKVALVHSADMADVAAESGFSLYLAGHTHGGQICLPSGRPLYIDLKRFVEYGQGIWFHDDMVGLTNVGAGASLLPYRFFSTGEVVLLTLRRGPRGTDRVPTPGRDQ